MTTMMNRLCLLAEKLLSGMLTSVIGRGPQRRMLLWMATVVVAAGCGAGGGGTAHWQGQVTLKGQPIPSDAQAFVTFVPDDKNAETVSVPIIQGRYDSPQTPMGPVKVFFEINPPVGPMKKSERTGQPYQDIVSLVPAKYATGVAVEVKGDDPNHDFQLTN
jgi:hypothetical protein